MSIISGAKHELKNQSNLRKLTGNGRASYPQGALHL